MSFYRDRLLGECCNMQPREAVKGEIISLYGSYSESSCHALVFDTAKERFCSKGLSVDRIDFASVTHRGMFNVFCHKKFQGEIYIFSRRTRETKFNESIALNVQTNEL